MQLTLLSHHVKAKCALVTICNLFYYLMILFVGLCVTFVPLTLMLVVMALCIYVNINVTHSEPAKPNTSISYIEKHRK